MLKEIYVENFAIIDKMQLDLTAGFNVLTGETGAGKSLITDALALLTGGRAQQDFIRSGTDRCFVQGVFMAPFPADLPEFLAQNALTSEEDLLLLSRELHLGGKSVCRVNSRIVTLNVLKEVGRRLINIHGQLEHILLLEEEKQRIMLDNYGGAAVLSLLQKTAAAFTQYRTYEQALQENEKNQKEILRKIDFLQFQIKEIEEAALVIGEEEQLRKERSRLENAEKLKENVHFIIATLQGEASRSVLEKLAEAMPVLQETAAYDDHFSPLADRFTDIYYNLEDIAHELNGSQDDLPADEYRMEEVDRRLQTIKKLQKKYAPTVEEILYYLQKCREELTACENFQADNAQLDKLLLQARETYLQLGGELSAKRAEIALLLAEKIKEQLHQLQMPDADFCIALQKKEDNASGFDQVDFLIRPNPGEEMLPVAKIASGGEMSRIMLALKVVLAQTDTVPTLIFDEIDSGLGGRALNAVAEKLKEVSAFSQVLCVTHAPMIAGSANRHIIIDKKIVAERTRVVATVLNEEQRVAEISRMLAGEKATKITQAQAKEILTHNK